MAFLVMIFLPILDIAYTVANMQVCSSFPAHSQALAGSIFSVATRVRSSPVSSLPKLTVPDAQLGTSIGLAVTSTIANSVSTKFNNQHPDLSTSDPSVLMAGFRAAGWTCCGTIAIALIVALVGMRGVGLVGQHRPTRAEKPELGDVEMAPRRAREESEERTAYAASVATLPVEARSSTERAKSVVEV